MAIPTWLNSLWQDLVSLYQHRKTLQGHALHRHDDLRWRYVQDKEKYYDPPGQRKLRSHDSLFVFPEAQLLADEARHSIRTGDYEGAHKKIDQGLEVLREAAHLRFQEQMAAHARQINSSRNT